MRKHCAYNFITGEILSTNHANHLKRWVKSIGYGGWIFSHCYGKDLKARGYFVD